MIRTAWRVLASRPRKLARKSLRATWRAASDDTIIAVWWNDIPNWGDIVNPVLVGHLSGREPVQYDTVVNLRGRPVYSVIGSVLDRLAVPRVEVWGSGFKTADARFWIRPRRIHAVRGPLTRDAVLRLGLPCPAVYGDPALLFPRVYRPPLTARYALGIVPHYVDSANPALARFRERDDVLIVDILAGVRAVADQIASCAAVASSSLHGMILADAYGIPSAWIEFSEGVEGAGFKFRDYFAGVNRAADTPLRMTAATTFDEITDRMPSRPIDADLESLLAACPFYRETA